ncbi:MAG: dTMP kinase [Ruminiclostridium sp.]
MGVNTNNKGKLFVIEGLDGCGKSTQLEMLKNKTGNNTRFISFPNYDSASGQIIKDYLSGKFAEENGKAGAYTASSFYAVDRYISYKTDWEKDYQSGKTIIAARYTSSNAIYQMTKLDKAQWDEYLSWLEDYEYEKFGIPRPDKVVFLDMPIEVSQKLLSSRYGGNEDKKDIHERNVDFLKACREAALYTAKRKGWFILPCSDGENPFTPESINEQLSALILDN